TFDRFDGLDLRDGEITLLFVHEDVGIPDSLDFLAEGDVISSNLSLKIDTSVTSFVATYGVTEMFDVGLIVPVVDIDVSYAIAAQIERLSTYQTPGTHQFTDGSSAKTFGYSGSAHGLGDITLRGKWRLPTNDTVTLAGTAEVRFPTGDELDLLGTGAFQGRASLLMALPGATFSPHVNAGFAAASGSTLSDEVDYRAGFDWAVDPKMTLAADLIGQTLLSADRAFLGKESHRFFEPQQGRILSTDFPVLFQESDQVRNRLQAAVGAKINVTGNVLLSGSGLIALSNDGLTDDFSALAGIDYSS
ncbi:MAG: transporter, partial [Candidatus Eisenbacteria bacterium]|nr:transporter [Candidatus Eisenbacteria bacterium]